MSKKNNIKKKEFEVVFKTIGYIERIDLVNFKAGAKGAGTYGFGNTCTDRRPTRINATCADNCLPTKGY